MILYQNFINASVVDCILSEWSSYNKCNVTCGNGFKTRQRTVLSPERNGGKCDIPRSRIPCTMDQCKSGDEIPSTDTDSSGKT